MLTAQDAQSLEGQVPAVGAGIDEPPPADPASADEGGGGGEVQEGDIV